MSSSEGIDIDKNKINAAMNALGQLALGNNDDEESNSSINQNDFNMVKFHKEDIPEWSEWFQSPLNPEKMDVGTNMHLANHNRLLTKELDRIFAEASENSSPLIDNDIGKTSSRSRSRSPSPSPQNDKRNANIDIVLNNVEKENDNENDFNIKQNLHYEIQTPQEHDAAAEVEAAELDRSPELLDRILDSGMVFNEYGGGLGGSMSSSLSDGTEEPEEFERIAQENTYRNQMMLHEMASSGRIDYGEHADEGFALNRSFDDTGLGGSLTMHNMMAMTMTPLQLQMANMDLGASFTDTKSVTFAEQNSVLEFDSEVVNVHMDGTRVTIKGSNLEDDGSDEIIAGDAIGAFGDVGIPYASGSASPNTTTNNKMDSNLSPVAISPGSRQHNIIDVNRDAEKYKDQYNANNDVVRNTAADTSLDMLLSHERTEEMSGEGIDTTGRGLLGNSGVDYPMDTGTPSHGYRRREEDNGENDDKNEAEILSDNGKEQSDMKLNTGGMSMGVQMNMNMLDTDAEVSFLEYDENEYDYDGQEFHTGTEDADTIDINNTNNNDDNDGYNFNDNTGNFGGSPSSPSPSAGTGVMSNTMEITQADDAEHDMRRIQSMLDEVEMLRLQDEAALQASVSLTASASVSMSNSLLQDDVHVPMGIDSYMWHHQQQQQEEYNHHTDTTLNSHTDIDFVEYQGQHEDQSYVASDLQMQMEEESQSMPAIDGFDAILGPLQELVDAIPDTAADISIPPTPTSASVSIRDGDILKTPNESVSRTTSIIVAEKIDTSNSNVNQKKKQMLQKKTSTLKPTTQRGGLKDLLASSANYAEKRATMPTPPRFSCECPVVPQSVVEQRQLLAHGDCISQPLPRSTRKARFSIRARVSPEWEETNKPPDDVVPMMYEFLLRTPQLTGGKALPTQDAKKQLFRSFYTQTYDHLAASHYTAFMRRFRMGFNLIVLDRHMDVMGTYSQSMPCHFPGITINPPYLQKHRTGQPGTPKNGTLFEIDFAALPEDVFAIIPLINDDDPYPNQVADIRVQSAKFQVECALLADLAEVGYDLEGELSTYAAKVADNSDVPADKLWRLERAAEAIAVMHELKGNGTKKVNDYDSMHEDDDDRSDATSAFTSVADTDNYKFNDVMNTPAYMEGEMDGEGEIEEASGDSMQSQSQTSFLHPKGWVHLFFKDFARLTRADKVEFDAFQASLAKDLNTRRKSKALANILKEGDYEYSKCDFAMVQGEIYIPFAIYRQRAAANGWAMRHFHITQPAVPMYFLLDKILSLMREHEIVPMHILHVEHCVNCEQHALSCRHVPGSYDRKYEDLVGKLRKRLPTFVYYNNHPKVVDKKHPRIGTFEVLVRPYWATSAEKVYSKISKKRFPSSKDILAHLSSLVLPETIHFGVSALLDVHVFDAYHQKVIPRAHVRVIRVQTQLLEHDQYTEEFCSNIESSKQRRLTSVTGNSNGEAMNTTMNTTMTNDSITGVKGKSRVGSKAREAREQLSAAGVLRAKDSDAAAARHSVAFSKVRSWGRNEVENWLLTFEDVNTEVLYKAELEGCVDGISLLQLANENSLKKWGVRSRRSRRAILTVLNKFHEDSDHHAADAGATVGAVMVHSGKDMAVPMVEGYRVDHDSDLMTNQLNAEVISSGHTNSKGLYRCEVKKSGTYLVEISHDNNQVHVSNLFTIFETCRTSYYAPVRPLFGRVSILIDLDGEKARRSLSMFADDGLLVSFINLRSGKRHIVFCPMIPEKDEKTLLKEFAHLGRGGAPEKARKKHDTFQMNSMFSDHIKKRSTTYSAIQGLDESKKSSNAVPQAQQEEGIIKYSELILCGDGVIPVGKYYSETTGEIVNIYPPSKTHVDGTMNDLTETRVRLKERLSLKNHKRITLKTVSLFQRIFRRYQKNYAERKVAVYLTLRMGLRRVLKRIRKKIANRKATKIQAIWCMYKAKQNLQIAKNSTVVIQSRMRVVIAKTTKHRLKFAHVAIIVQSLVRMLISKRRLRRIKFMGRFLATRFAVLLRKHLDYLSIHAKEIQKIWRGKAARFKVGELLKRRAAMNAMMVLGIAIRAKVARMRARSQDEKIAIIECAEMLREELYMKRYLKKKKAMEDKKHAAARKKLIAQQKYQEARRVAREMHHRKTAIKIQKWVRMIDTRWHYKRIRHGICSLQAAVRHYLRECRNERAETSAFRKANIERMKKQKEDREKNNVKKENGDDEEDSKLKLTWMQKILIKFGFFKSLQPTDPLGDVLSEVLHKPASKCQSLVRMHRTRKQYFAKRKVLGLKPPKLFRYSKSRIREMGVVTRAVPKRKPPKIKSKKAGYEESPKYVRGIRGFLIKRNRRVVRAVISLQAAWRGYAARKAVYTQLYMNHDLEVIEKLPFLHQSPMRKTRRRSLSPSSTGSRGSPTSRAASPEDFHWNLSPDPESPVLSQSPLNSANILSPEDGEVDGIDRMVEAMGLNREFQDQTPSRGIILDSASLSPTKDDKVETEIELSPFQMAAKRAGEDLKRQWRIITGRGNNILSQSIENATKTAKKVGKFVGTKANDLIKKQQESRERMARQLKSEVSISDALMSCRGTVQKRLPRLDRRWYVCIVPSTTDIKIRRLEDQLFTSPQFDAFGSAARDLQSNIMFNESTRSEMIFPFTYETVHALTFHVHLADIARYKTVEICVFMESHNSLLTEKEWIAEKNKDKDAGFSALVNNAQETISNVARGFRAMFYGYIDFKSGAAFGPAGGRLTVNLKPSISEVAQLPRSSVLMEGLSMTLSLLPVAIPSASFLSRYFIRQPPPVTPVCFVDAPILETASVKWDNFSGGALAVGCFKDRLIVSARTKGAGCTLFEYSPEGDMLGYVTTDAMSDSVSSVTLIITGHWHMACAGNNGAIMFTREVRAEPNNGPSIGVEGDHGKVWDEPLIVPIHQAGITCGCVVTHAGMDVFYTCDRKGFLAVNMLDGMDLVRSVANPPFTHYKITDMRAFGSTLYASLSDGSILVIDMTKFLNGTLTTPQNLRDHVLKIKKVFGKGTISGAVASGIECLGIYSSNALLDMHCEDEAIRMEEIKKKKAKTAVDFEDKTHFDALEGHTLIVGGSDLNPTVKLLTRHSRGIREVAELKAHEKAITKVCADAAGRFIFTASTGDKKVLIWDALTFICEAKFENLGIGDMTLGPNCLLISTFKPPFIRLWNVPQEQILRNKRKIDEDSEDANKQSDNNRNRIEVTDDDISLTRHVRWCYGMLKKADYVPGTAVTKPLYLDEISDTVVERWLSQYPIGKSTTRHDILAAAQRRRNSTRLASSFLQNQRRASAKENANMSNTTVSDGGTLMRSHSAYELGNGSRVSQPLGIIYEKSKRPSSASSPSQASPETNNRGSRRGTGNLGVAGRSREVSGLKGLTTSMQSAFEEVEEIEVDMYADMNMDQDDEEGPPQTDTDVSPEELERRREAKKQQQRREHLMRQGRFAHFSDDEDEELSRPGKRHSIVGLPDQESNESKLMNYEKAARAREEKRKEDLRRKQVSERQRKLRPRNVVHLMDLDDDDDDEDNVMDKVWNGPDIIGSLRSSFNQVKHVPNEEEIASFSNQSEDD